jgi:predicted exporter
MGPRRCIALSLVMLGIAATGWMHLHGQDDVRQLVATDADLRHQEERIKSLTGMDSSSQFFLVEGHDEDEVLQHEEALRRALIPAIAAGDIQSYQAVSVFVPSRQRQQEAMDVWVNKILSPAARLPAVLAQAGLQDSVARQLRDNFSLSSGRNLSVSRWLAQPVSAPWRQLWMGKTAHGVASVVLPMGLRSGADLSALAMQVPGVLWVDKPASVSRAFHDYRVYSGYWLAGAVLLVYALLALRYGLRSAAAVLLPTVLALAVSLGAYGWMGRPLTLFNMMALMLVLGVGVNYAIFLYEGGARSAITFAGVQLSAATTLLSFGLLALSSMPALAGFGASLSFGIACAVVLSPMALSLAQPRELRS